MAEPESDVLIRAAAPTDAEAVCAIYNPYVLGTAVTFEEVAVTADDMRQRIAEVTVALPWLVAEQDGQVVAYAYATRWRTRAAYRYSVESTVYVKQGRQGRGIGSALYRTLLNDLHTRGLHVVIGGIALPNAASVALHEKLGFRKVAEFEQVGFKFGEWRNVGYWQREL